MFEYLRNDSLEVNIINDNVYITNYLEVLLFSREEIKLKHKDGIIKVIGEVTNNMDYTNQSLAKKYGV